jgi:hypothetical protein
MKNLPGISIEKKILFLRHQKVILDSDLAELYGVSTKVLVQAVKRNVARFPPDFAFQMTAEEFKILRSQNVTSSWGGRRFLPYAFTEQGVAMLSSVLKSRRAIEVNIMIMRVFVRLREMVISHRELSEKIRALEKKYDSQFKVVFDALRELTAKPEKPRSKFGFQPPTNEKKNDS